MRKTRQTSGERIVKDIKRKTRKQYSAEEKIRIVLDGLRGEESVAELCRIEGIVRRHIKWHRLRPGLRETLLTSLVDIKRGLCGIASVDVRLFFS